MNAPKEQTPERVLAFWLGQLDEDGLSPAVVQTRWWVRDAVFDERVRSEFGATWEEVVAGEHQDWLTAPRSLLAYVIVLDQFSRNLLRDDRHTFDNDGKALEVAKSAIAKGWDAKLTGQERVFLYMPFMHSEDLAMQERSIELFTAFRDAYFGRLREALDSNLKFAIQHRDIVARFGRFPHRNAALGRTSSAEESAFLQQPGSSF